MARILTQAEALREAIALEMERDPAVILFGEGAHDGKITYGTTTGLADRFGGRRVFDTPLAEEGMTGVAIGAALAGLRPIHFHQRMDFLMLAMNQIVNIAAKSRYMYGGAVCVPIVIRSVIGRSWGQGAQHSQGLYAFFMHVPGLKVVAPTTPYDAKGCLTRAIRDDNPVVFVEHRMLHNLKGEVPAEPYELPFGEARVLARGVDVTLVGISYMAVECVRARHLLEEVGISAEVIDPVSLSPLDSETISASVRKTGRLVVVDSGQVTCGAGAEIVSRVLERLQGKRDFLVRRLGFQPVPCPTSRNLETLYYPNARQIASEAHGLVRGRDSFWVPPPVEAREIVEFRGPF